MASVTDIVNVALRKLKANRITSITDGSNNANAANDVYDETRDALLRGHTWKFGQRRKSLARLTATPTFEFDHAYALLSEPYYAKRAKYGYCRSEEIIGYVRKIMSRYISYDAAQNNPAVK